MALITGASGTGPATAKLFVEAGAALALADVQEGLVRAQAGKLWLCSPGASYVIRHALTVDGGLTVA